MSTRRRPRPDTASADSHEPAHESSDAPPTDPRLEEATREWFDLLACSDQSYEHRTAVANAGAKVWSIRSELLADSGEHDAARKAASTANELSSLAVKLDMSAVVDRVTALETMLRQSRNDATRLATLK